jgi:uncharacterized protein YjbI with pentapeptide repeats
MTTNNTFSDLIKSNVPRSEMQQLLNTFANHQQVVREAEIRSVDLSGLDLSRLKLEDVVFNNVSVHDAILGDAQNCLFLDCRLMGTKLLHSHKCNFDGTVFSECYFGARSRNLTFTDSWILSSMFGEYFEGLPPSRNKFISTTCSRVSACGTNFQESVFEECRLLRSVFSRALFHGARFEDTVVENSNFSQSHLDSRYISSLLSRDDCRPDYLNPSDLSSVWTEFGQFFDRLRLYSNNGIVLRASVCMVGRIGNPVVQLFFIIGSDAAIRIQSEDYFTQCPIRTYGLNKVTLNEADLLAILSDHLGFVPIGSGVSLVGADGQSSFAFSNELSSAWRSIVDALSVVIGGWNG